jgi:Protein of unknown function (DUF2844)
MLKHPFTRKPIILVVGGIFIALATAFPAWAALGGDVTTVQADQVHMQGSIRTSATTAAYTVHEIQSPAGTVVREYVSTAGASAGKVFGIAWQGQWPPDMRQLLGSYFDQYIQAAKAQSAGRVGRRPVMIELPGLVVEVGGHPRAFTGRAFVPGMVPASIRAEDIR